MKKAIALIFIIITTLSACANTETISETVYITSAGAKYHVESCQYLTKSKNPIDLEKAKEEGYEPCSKCNPPE